MSAIDLTEVERAAALEREIALAHDDLLSAIDGDARREACDRLTRLVNSRSPEVVAEMEYTRGLR